MKRGGCPRWWCVLFLSCRWKQGQAKLPRAVCLVELMLRDESLVALFAPIISYSRKVRTEFRKTREGWNCRFQKTPRTEGGDKVPAVSTQGSRQVCLSRARNPRICSISRFGKNFPAIFPRLFRSFPGEPLNRPRKQPQPSRVF